MIAVFRNGCRDPEDSLRIVKLISNEVKKGDKVRCFIRGLVSN